MGFYPDKFFNKFPQAIRNLDDFSTEQLDVTFEDEIQLGYEGQFKRFSHIIEKELDVIDGFIDNFIGIFNPETCESKFIPYNAKRIGLTPNYDVDEKYQRREILNHVPSLKRKGTKSAIQKLVQALTDYDVTVVEFYKNLIITNKSDTERASSENCGYFTDIVNDLSFRRLDKRFYRRNVLGVILESTDDSFKNVANYKKVRRVINQNIRGGYECYIIVVHKNHIELNFKLNAEVECNVDLVYQKNNMPYYSRDWIIRNITYTTNNSSSWVRAIQKRAEIIYNEELVLSPSFNPFVTDIFAKSYDEGRSLEIIPSGLNNDFQGDVNFLGIPTNNIGDHFLNFNKYGQIYFSSISRPSLIRGIEGRWFDATNYGDDQAYKGQLCFFKNKVYLPKHNVTLLNDNMVGSLGSTNISTVLDQEVRGFCNFQDTYIYAITDSAIYKSSTGNTGTWSLDKDNVALSFITTEYANKVPMFEYDGDIYIASNIGSDNSDYIYRYDPVTKDLTQVCPISTGYNDCVVNFTKFNDGTDDYLVFATRENIYYSKTGDLSSWTNYQFASHFADFDIVQIRGNYIKDSSISSQLEDTLDSSNDSLTIVGGLWDWDLSTRVKPFFVRTKDLVNYEDIGDKIFTSQGRYSYEDEFIENDCCGVVYEYDYDSMVFDYDNAENNIKENLCYVLVRGSRDELRVYQLRNLENFNYQWIDAYSSNGSEFGGCDYVHNSGDNLILGGYQKTYIFSKTGVNTGDSDVSTSVEGTEANWFREYYQYNTGIHRIFIDGSKFYSSGCGKRFTITNSDFPSTIESTNGGWYDFAKAGSYYYGIITNATDTVFYRCTDGLNFTSYQWNYGKVCSTIKGIGDILYIFNTDGSVSKLESDVFTNDLFALTKQGQNLNTLAIRKTYETTDYLWFINSGEIGRIKKSDGTFDKFDIPSEMTDLHGFCVSDDKIFITGKRYHYSQDTLQYEDWGLIYFAFLSNLKNWFKINDYPDLFKPSVYNDCDFDGVHLWLTGGKAGSGNLIYKCKID